MNQTLLKLASRCRNEVLKDRSAAATMKIRIQNLEDQVSDEEKEIVQLREAVQERNSQLEGVRSAFHREVVQVKEEVVKNMTHKGAMIEDMEELVSRGFDLNLLAEPLGSGAVCRHHAPTQHSHPLATNNQALRECWARVSS